MRKPLPSEDIRAYVDARTRDIENAAQRSRWVYVALITMSWLMFSIAYNSTWSWGRLVADAVEDRWQNQDPMSIDVQVRAECKSADFSEYCIEGLKRKFGLNGNSPSDWLSQRYLDNWVGSLSYELPIVGVKFSAPDGGLVGGFALLLLGIWGFYSARRENHLVYYLVRDVENWKWGATEKAYVRLQLAATQVFTRGWHDKALGSKNLVGGTEKSPKSEDKLMRLLLALMLMLPIATFGFVIVSDIYSLFLDSPIRSGPDSLWTVLKDSCSSSNSTGCHHIADVAVRLSASVVLFVLVVYSIARWHTFQYQTSDLLAFTQQWKLPREE